MKTTNYSFSRLLLAATLVALFAQAGRAELTNLWSFDFDFNDSVGGATTAAVENSGTVTNTSAANEFVVGEGGLRISHGDGGGGDYIDVMDAVFPSGDVFSINLFYRYDASISAQNDARPFLFETSPVWSVGAGLRSPEFDTEWFFEGALSDTSGVGADDGQWHQATLVWDKTGSNSVKFYQDGYLKDSRPLNTSVFNVAGQEDGLHIGNHRDGDGGRNWSGFIDEFAIYDHALTTSEVETLHSVAFGSAPATPNPFQAAAIEALQFSAPEGTDVEYVFSGWDTASYTDNPDGDDFGDGGFAGESYLQTQGVGDNTIEVTLTNLPDHEYIQVGGILAQLDSLDPVRDQDRFRVLVDGVEVFQRGFGYGVSVSGDFSDELYTDADGNPLQLPADAATLSDADLFGSAEFNENMYDLSKFSELASIPHSGSTLTLSIVGFQNQSGGEFYGIDQLSVSIVPEPSSLVILCIAGFGLVAHRRTR